ncbi:MAG: hypothetical protein AAGE52_12435 [Myxococcota bacterium]
MDDELESLVDAALETAWDVACPTAREIAVVRWKVRGRELSIEVEEGGQRRVLRMRLDASAAVDLRAMEEALIERLGEALDDGVLDAPRCYPFRYFGAYPASVHRHGWLAVAFVCEPGRSEVESVFGRHLAARSSATPTWTWCAEDRAEVRFGKDDHQPWRPLPHERGFPVEGRLAAHWRQVAVALREVHAVAPLREVVNHYASTVENDPWTQASEAASSPDVRLLDPEGWRRYAAELPDVPVDPTRLPWEIPIEDGPDDEDATRALLEAAHEALRKGNAVAYEEALAALAERPGDLHVFMRELTRQGRGGRAPARDALRRSRHPHCDRALTREARLGAETEVPDVRSQWALVLLAERGHPAFREVIVELAPILRRGNRAATVAFQQAVVALGLPEAEQARLRGRLPTSSPPQRDPAAAPSHSNRVVVVDELGAVVILDTPVDDHNACATYLIRRLDGDVPIGVPPRLAESLQGCRIDFAAPIEDPARLTVEGSPVADFDRAPFRARAPQVGMGSVVVVDGKGYFVTRDPVPDRVLEALRQALQGSG